MTHRERNLSIGVATLLVGFALYNVITWTILTPFANVKKAIADAQGRQANLLDRLKKTADVRAQWQQVVGRTLAADVNTAQESFRSELQELLEKHKLAEPSVTPLPAQSLKNGLVEASVSVRATGNLSQITAFLYDFYSLQCWARLDRFKLTIDEQGTTKARGDHADASEHRAAPPPPPPSGSGGRAALKSSAGKPASSSPPPAASTGKKAAKSKHIGDRETGPVLQMTLTAATLITPALPGVAATPASMPAVPVQQRMTESELEDYAVVWKTNLFKEYQPPKPPAPPRNENDNNNTPHIAQGNSNSPDRPPPGPKKAERNAEKQVLTATTSLYGKLIAYVRDTDKVSDPAKKIGLNADLDDGIVVLIVPKGIVVHVTKETTDGAPGDNFFYPLGKNFEERVPLSEHPDLQELVEQVVAQK